MKVSIDLELTPEEFRRLMGLPDVSGLQQDMIEQIRQRAESGADGYDPATLMQPFLAGGAGSMEGFQKMMMSLMKNYSKGSQKE